MLISKAEFARRRNVSGQRVSQWLSEGKIHGAAIVGEGRSALIDEEIACRQLDQKLDIDQRHSNGLRTNLTPESTPKTPTIADAPPLPDPPAGNTVADLIALERLEGLQRQNREKAVAELVRLGVLIDAAKARRAVAEEIAQLIARFDAELVELATSLSAQFKLPQRDVLHFLRTEFRKMRTRASIAARECAEPMPEMVGFDLDDERPDGESVQ